jgi:hypothetical protein
MASQFVSLDDALRWLYEYSNGEPEDGEVESIVDFLTTFAEGYVVDAVGDWILLSDDAKVISKVRLLIQAIVSDLYSSRALTDEQATHRSARMRYMYQGTFNQLNVLQPPIDDSVTVPVDLWRYL